jgi:hypothetical protein
MRAACTAAGLDSTAASLMRLGENALFHWTATGVVVRIARTMDYWDDAVKEVNVAHWLTDNHFPAAETFDADQPVKAAGRPVTFWQFIDGRPGDERDIATLGTVLRRLPRI